MVLIVFIHLLYLNLLIIKKNIIMSRRKSHTQFLKQKAYERVRTLLDKELEGATLNFSERNILNMYQKKHK